MRAYVMASLVGAQQRHCLWKQCKLMREVVSFVLGNWEWREVNRFVCDYLIQPVLIPIDSVKSLPGNPSPV